MPLMPPARNAPPDATAAPFLVTPDPGAVDTAFENAGIVNMRADRSQEGSVPWTGPLPNLLRKLTHFRAPGMGDPMWSGQCVYDLQGQSPSYSEYEQPDVYAHDDGLDYSITAGVVKQSDRLDVGEPTTTRRSRVSAHFDSAPAAATFQGYFNPRWSGLFAGYFHPVVDPRPLHMNFNPGQMGTKELHKATQYQPVPPMGSLVGYFGTVNDKAI